MKEQMKRTVYEAPETRLFRIEMEGNFCGSAEVRNPEDGEISKISDHVVNDNFNSFDDDMFSSDGWGK